MSLQTRIESLVVRIAQEFNAVNTKTGALANLTTATPTLAGHAWSLPRDALQKYKK